MNYYNEYDAKAAAWLRSLISAGLIPNGHVDDRSIADVQPGDLRGYTQCHFFAGIGGWSRALFLAGIPETMPVWTGSCPCQPFSVAGKRKGIEDERHLWPAFRDLIAQCKPPAVFGEQVASADGRNWLAVVRSEMETLGYAVGAADLCAAGVGSPHIRQRLYFVGLGDSCYSGLERTKWKGIQNDGIGFTNDVGAIWMADSHNEGSQGRVGMSECSDQCAPGQDGMACGMANTEISGLGEYQRNARAMDCQRDRNESQEPEFIRTSQTTGDHGKDGGLADARCSSVQCCGGPSEAPREAGEDEGEAQQRKRGGTSDWSSLPPRPADPPDGFWGNSDWLWCRDGKWRPVESGSSPLAHGVSGRVALLRGYGNAIVPQVAAEFIKAALLSRLDL